MEVPHQPQRTTIVLPSTPPTTSTTILAQLSLHSPCSTALSLWKLHFPSTIPLHSCTLPLAPLLLHLPSTLCGPPLLSSALLGGCASQSPPRQLGVAPPHAPPLRCVRGWLRPSLWLTFFALRGFLDLVFLFLCLLPPSRLGRDVVGRLGPRNLSLGLSFGGRRSEGSSLSLAVSSPSLALFSCFAPSSAPFRSFLHSPPPFAPSASISLSLYDDVSWGPPCS